MRACSSHSDASVQVGWNNLKLDMDHSGGKRQAMNIWVAELKTNNVRFDCGVYDEPF